MILVSHPSGTRFVALSVSLTVQSLPMPAAGPDGRGWPKFPPIIAQTDGKPAEHAHERAHQHIWQGLPLPLRQAPAIHAVYGLQALCCSPQAAQ